MQFHDVQEKTTGRARTLRDPRIAGWGAPSPSKPPEPSGPSPLWTPWDCRKPAKLKLRNQNSSVKIDPILPRIKSKYIIMGGYFIVKSYDFNEHERKQMKISVFSSRINVNWCKLAFSHRNLMKINGFDCILLRFPPNSSKTLPSETPKSIKLMLILIPITAFLIRCSKSTSCLPPSEHHPCAACAHSKASTAK